MLFYILTRPISFDQVMFEKTNAQTLGP